MTAALRIGTDLHDLTGIAVRKGAALKTVTQGLVRVGGVLKVFYDTLKVDLSTYNALGRANSAVVTNVTSGAVTANVTGAVGEISYAWTRTAPDAHAWTINSPASQATTFSTLANQGEEWTATFICTITDQAGQVLASSPVTVTNANIYYGGGYGGIGPGPYP
jgi:hypothetical protein